MMIRVEIAGRAVGFFALLMLSAAATQAEPQKRSVEYQVAANLFLEEARTKDEISQKVGIRSFRCVDTTPGLELCQWTLRDREVGWEDLARAIRTRDRIVVLCEVPKDGSPREGSECSANPRRSNRTLFSPPKTGPRRKRSGARQASLGYSRDENQRIAQSWIDEAQTLIEMSHLMGAVPSVCEPPSEGERLCIWRTTNKTYGHGTVAASLKVSSSKKVRLHCQFPVDGSPRRADSCFARVGG